MSMGTKDKVTGRVKKAAGELLDDDRLRDQGRVEETSGKIKDSVEKGVDKVKDALNRGRRP
jgi:uncharacterized protein YjbJ (UPF0337 family)